MFRTLAMSALAAAGLLLMPGQATTTNAAPSVAPRIATPESAVEQVRRRGGGHYRGHSFRSHSFRGGRSYRRSYAYYGGRRHRHRGFRHGIFIGAGIPFFYGGYYYGGYYYGRCSYYYRKWKRTGSRYWRHRYYDCRYYW